MAEKLSQIILELSDQFHDRVQWRRNLDNRIKVLLADRSRQISAEYIESMALRTRPIIHSRFLPLLQDFLILKLRWGTRVEKALYDGMTVDSFIERLLVRRPVVFIGVSDEYLLRDCRSGAGLLDKDNFY